MFPEAQTKSNEDPNTFDIFHVFGVKKAEEYVLCALAP